MPDVKIHKMSGAGNDFVVMDGRGKEMDEFREAERIRELCREFRTDGLMILDIALTDHTDFRMEFYNPDGSGGMMCGNGGRCIVAFADWLGIAPSEPGHYRFQAPDAPFYFVQIAPWKSKHPENITIPLFNEAQEKTLALIPNSGMAATVDIGEYGTIHPCRKKEVGDRLALLALTKTYGIQGTVVGSSSYKESVGLDAESPSYKEAVFVDGKAIVTMKVGKLGLSPIGQDLEGFELAGADGLFYPATGTVKDRYTLEVSSPDVPSPVAVRSCFHNSSRGTLYNCFGIPALPFRSDR